MGGRRPACINWFECTSDIDVTQTRTHATSTTNSSSLHSSNNIQLTSNEMELKYRFARFSRLTPPYVHSWSITFNVTKAYLDRTTVIRGKMNLKNYGGFQERYPSDKYRTRVSTMPSIFISSVAALGLGPYKKATNIRVVMWSISTTRHDCSA